MRKTLLFVATFALIGAAALAGPPDKPGQGMPPPPPGGERPGGPERHGRGPQRILNNVIKVDAKGARTALCVCGMEVPVTDKTVTWERRDQVFYMCSAGCRDHTAQLPPEEQRKAMMAWHQKFNGEKLATNAREAGGKLTAACVCGMKVDVTEQTPAVVENGMRVYFCGEGCRDQFAGKPAAERAAAEAKLVPAAGKS